MKDKRSINSRNVEHKITAIKCNFSPTLGICRFSPIQFKDAFKRLASSGRGLTTCSEGRCAGLGIELGVVATLGNLLAAVGLVLDPVINGLRCSGAALVI